MTRLIDADAIDKRYVPIAPVIKGDAVHYEWIAFIEDINELPTIEAESVRHGKWVFREGVIGHECSLCGKWIDVLQGTAGMHYCPNCGCRMDKDDC